MQSPAPAPVAELGFEYEESATPHFPPLPDGSDDDDDDAYSRPKYTRSSGGDSTGSGSSSDKPLQMKPGRMTTWTKEEVSLCLSRDAAWCHSAWRAGNRIARRREAARAQLAENCVTRARSRFRLSACVSCRLTHLLAARAQASLDGRHSRQIQADGDGRGAPFRSLSLLDPHRSAFK